MKTPKEIKKGFECCASKLLMCGECPYYETADGCKEMDEDALALIEQLEAKVPKWISVTEDIPVQMEDVFVLLGGKDIATGWFDAYNGGWHVDGSIAGEVTHWMMPPVLSKEG